MDHGRSLIGLSECTLENRLKEHKMSLITTELSHVRVQLRFHIRTYIYIYIFTSCVSYRIEMASELGIANLKFNLGSLFACSVDRVSFFVGCLNLGDILVDS